MKALSRVVAAKQAQIDHLQSEIDALHRAQSLLGPARRRQEATAPTARARKGRYKMSAAQKKAVSKRMKAYWANRSEK